MKEHMKEHINECTPNFWSILEWKYENETFYRIFATWSGSYLYGASWKISSPIVKAEGDTFTTQSGSRYHCRPNSYGVHWYGMGVLKNVLGDEMRLMEEEEVDSLNIRALGT